MTVREIAELLSAPFEGDGNLEIQGAGVVEQAGRADLAFAEGPHAEKAAASSSAGCLIIAEGATAPEGRAVIRVPKPRLAFARILRVLYPTARPAAGVHPTAVVAGSAVLEDGVFIGPHCIIGEDVRIGTNSVVGGRVSIGDGSVLGAECRLYPGVTVYHQVSIGNRVTLHAGAVIGSDGFGYVFEAGRYEKFPQIGTVEIGDDVEIGANSCVDRAALGATIIGEGTKLDNMVHIGHNCRLGRHVIIAAQTGLSGGVEVEDHVVMGGQVGISEKARIGKQAVIGAQCGILPLKRIPAGETVWGTPSRPHKQYLEKLALLGRLPKFADELNVLRKRMDRRESA